MGQHVTMADVRRPSGVAVVDHLWLDLRVEAETALLAEPALSGLLWPTILAQATFEDAVAYRVAARLDSGMLRAELIRHGFSEAFAKSDDISAAIRADALAVLDRDPACRRVLDPVVFFKGFHALQSHRLAHWLWAAGRRDFALLLQSRASEVFQTDIHPAARFGKGVFLDHATGFVAGETVLVEDDVSILQGVTLGGSGVERGDRHPKIRHGSLIGAGAQLIGPIEVGASSRVAAGSVVLEDVPPCVTVAGVPARIVGSGGCAEPSRVMDHRLGDAAYAAFTYTI